MITEAKLKYALKDMMKTLPLGEINVTELCKRCGCHRQTFYYHYQDIYDLVAAIFLNEDLSKMEAATDVKGVLKGFLAYAQGNLPFLIATYNSAARDLTEDFIFGKINAKMFSLWSERGTEPKLGKEAIRRASRRLARLVSDEFGNCFRTQNLTPEGFGKKMRSTIKLIEECMVPAILTMSKKEERDVGGKTFTSKKKESGL